MFSGGPSAMDSLYLKLIERLKYQSLSTLWCWPCCFDAFPENPIKKSHWLRVSIIFFIIWFCIWNQDYAQNVGKNDALFGNTITNQLDSFSPTPWLVFWPRVWPQPTPWLKLRRVFQKTNHIYGLDFGVSQPIKHGCSRLARANQSNMDV